MLKFLRNKRHQKKIYIILAIAIIPPFLMWGVTTTQKDSKIPSTVGVIENKKISLREYLNSYKAVQHEMAFMYGEKLKEVAPMINMKGEAWDRILFLHEAKKERIKANDAEVVEWVSRQPLFQSHGQFDTNIYNLYVSRYLHSNARDFEEDIRDILTIEKIADKIKSGIVIKEDELKTLYRQANGKRDILYGVVPWESEKDNVKISDDDVNKLYPLVKDRLAKPEKAQDKKSDQPLNTDEAKGELKRIMTRQKAMEAAVAKLNEAKNKMNGNDLEKTLKDLSVEAKRGEKFKSGDDLPGIGSSETVDQIIAKLKEGEVSQAFATPNGAGIFKITKDWDVDNKKFESEKEVFRKKMIDQKASEKMKTLLDKLRNQLKIDLETMRKIFAEEKPASY